MESQSHPLWKEPLGSSHPGVSTLLCYEVSYDVYTPLRIRPLAVGRTPSPQPHLVHEETLVRSILDRGAVFASWCSPALRSDFSLTFQRQQSCFSSEATRGLGSSPSLGLRALRASTASILSQVCQACCRPSLRDGVNTGHVSGLTIQQSPHEVSTAAITCSVFMGGRTASQVRRGQNTRLRHPT